MSERTVLIYNRFASKRHTALNVNNILNELEKAGISAQAVLTNKAGSGIEIAENAVKNGAERIIVSGGDGTVNETVNGLILAQKHGYGKATLGIIPNGRGNDYCFSMNIPLKLEDAVKIIQEGYTRPVDIGVAGDGTFERYFCNGSGFGIDSAINYRASISKLGGFPSYLWGLIQSLLLDAHERNVTITLDEQPEISLPILLFTAMNGKREGGGFILGPDFDIGDGKLDVTAIGDHIHFLSMLRLVKLIFKGDLSDPYFHTYKASSVHVHTDDKGMFAQVDGETIIKEGHDFYASIIPEKIDLFIKKPQKAC